MSLFEHTFNAYRENEDGSKQCLNPRDILQHRGPLLDVVIHVPNIAHVADSDKYPDTPSCVEGLALIDTGSSVSGIDKSVVETLALNSTGTSKVSHAGGSEDCNCYTANFQFPEANTLSQTVVNLLSLNLQNQGDISYVALIGRDVLAEIKFVYNGPYGRIELAK